MEMSASREIAVLERMIQPAIANIPPEAARFFLSLDFSQADQSRIDDLSAKARAGALTPDEQRDLEDYIRLSDFLALIQSKSRRSLQRGATPAA